MRNTLLIMSLVRLLILLTIIQINYCESNNFFQEFEKLMGEESERALELLQSELLQGYDINNNNDSPKEITITCPSDPVVDIQDIPPEESESQCSVIKMTGPNFNFRLELNCGNAEDD